MANIITLLDEKHGEAQSLLPWYLTGRLGATDRANVEAHLADCAECRAELSSERRLMAEWASLPMEAEFSWLRLRERLAHEPSRRGGGGDRSAAPRRAARNVWRSAAPGLGWALAAVQALALVVLGVSSQPPAQSAAYHTLGAGSPPAAGPGSGNVLVMFRPDTREQAIRDMLNASHARLVDGPTAADAYLLRVRSSERDTALAKLRRRPDVTLAQPVDAGATR